MRYFLRYFIPITYFQASRLNRWELVGYNGLVEWMPALALSIYFNEYNLAIVPKVLLSYLAFICIYEIGYITNDFFSERFEKEPRGRSAHIDACKFVVYSLIGFRLTFFVLFTYLAGAMGNTLWWTFHGTLLVTFALHNILPNELRIPTFFGLSTYRFFAPMILTLDAHVLMILVPTILLNNSLYRITVYLGNKDISIAESRRSVKFKFAFYAGCLPLSVFLSAFFGSVLPVGICVYFIFVWLTYWIISRFLKRDLLSS